MTTPDPSRLELAITQLGGRMDTALARIEGRLDLLVQRSDHADQRASDQAGQIQRLDDRVDKVEAHAVTRAEMDERAKRTLQIVAIIVTLLGSATGAGTAILIAVISNGG